MAILSVPFADFFNVTVPIVDFESTWRALDEFLVPAGAYEQFPGLLRLGGQAPDEGTVKIVQRHQVGCFSFSGLALAALREHRLLESVLWTFAQVEHRVTMLHATVDAVQDGPSVVKRVARLGESGKFQLTRKVIAARHVSKILGVGMPDGRVTGTVLLGKRQSDVRLKVYDKRSQLLCRGSENGYGADWVLLNDPGPLTRYELELGRHVGVSLRDVAEPSAVFWHFLPRRLLVPVGSVPGWVAYGEGFDLPARVVMPPAQQLKLLLGKSGDVRRVLSLARQAGPHGFEYLVNQLRSLSLRAEGVAVTGAAVGSV